MTEKECREAVIAIAKQFEGCKEGDATHTQLVGIYNSIRPLPRGYAMTIKDSWCAAYISVVFYMADMEYTVPAECSCYYMMCNAKSIGNWNEQPAEIQIGDIVMYNFDSQPDPDHVGIIIKKVGKTLTVLEGNHNDSCSSRTISMDSESIMGYILPNYADFPEIDAPINPVNPDWDYININTWNYDGTGWWYPYGHYKGQFHVNNAWRIDGKLYFFDTEGYSVKNPKIETDDNGALIRISGERVK